MCRRTRIFGHPHGLRRRPHGAARHRGHAGGGAPAHGGLRARQARLRGVSGGSLALAGGFLMLSMWTLRATWPCSCEPSPPLMADAGVIFTCAGCCCGHPDSGGPKTPPRTLKREMRRAFRDAKLEGRVRLAFTDCLGPCSEANVVFLYLRGRPLWVRRVNGVDIFTMLLEYVLAVLETHDADLPAALAVRSFSWTGGGRGPEPPLADAT